MLVQQGVGVLHVEVDDDLYVARFVMYESLADALGWHEALGFCVPLACMSYTLIISFMPCAEYSDVGKMRAIGWWRVPLFPEVHICPGLNP